jgi:hypothetical protein
MGMGDGRHCVQMGFGTTTGGFDKKKRLTFQKGEFIMKISLRNEVRT